jgi:hypothetical protein
MKLRVKTAKYYVLKSALMVFMGTAPFSDGGAENLLSNSGFEEGTAGWVNFWGETGSLSTERFRTGTKSARINQFEGRPHGSGWAQTAEGLEVGAIYRADAHVYRNVDTVTAHVWIVPQGNFPYPRASTTSEKTQTTGTWELISCEMPARMIDSWQGGSLMVHVLAEGTGEVWVDDVSLSQVKTAMRQKAELATVIAFPIAPAAKKAQAYLDRGEISFAGARDLDSALTDFGEVLRLVPEDTNTCLLALSGVLETYRRQNDFSNATRVVRQIVDDYTFAGTADHAKEVTKFGNALVEEADHLVPNYAEALQRLDEATNLYQRAITTYTAIDAAAHKVAIEIAEDKLIAVRQDIKEYRADDGNK